MIESSTMDPSLRVVMLGTGDFALPTFNYLLERGRHHMIALLTQPDRPQGRRQEIIPSLIKQSAQAHGIRTLQPEDVNAPVSLDVIRGLQPDLLVTAAYGQILSPELLSIPRLGGINLHGSILPAYRGAAPVARAIQNGETETGVTVIQMTPRIDAGGIAATAATPIELDETASGLEERLANIGAPLVARIVDSLALGPVPVLPQDRSKVTRAPKLRKEEGLIDWSRPARAIHNHVRAMQPWPTASTLWQPRGSETKPPVRLIVHRTEVAGGEGTPGEVIEASGERLVVAGAEGALALLLIQLPGKKPSSPGDFLRGHRIVPGEFMGG
jgi:methionyl-tRNA formyltransferase